MLFSCNNNSMPISDTLATTLKDKSRYKEYVCWCYSALLGDTSALKKIMLIDNLYDGPGYDHGYMLIFIMEQLGDEEFSQGLIKLNESQKNNVREYFNAGLDMLKNQYRDSLEIKYPRTFKTLQLSEIIIMDDSLSETLRQHCNLWLNSWERELKTDSFALVRSYISSLSTDWEKFDISEKYFSDYRDKIYYSPNGFYALDLYSYNLILNKKGAKTHAVLDADIQIYVIDIAHHQRLPILFFGPSASIDDGYWLSDSTVVLVGWERCFNCPEEAYTPVVSKVNVFTGKTVEYYYKSVFSHYNKDYLKQKFPKIIFDF